MRESVVYQEILQTGKQEEARSLVIRQLNRRLGGLNPLELGRIQALSLEELESLAEALLDFSNPEDLVAWLNERSPQ